MEARRKCDARAQYLPHLKNPFLPGFRYDCRIIEAVPRTVSDERLYQAKSHPPINGKADD
jgi:hypothetical protein